MRVSKLKTFLYIKQLGKIMKITICGSIAFFEEMISIKKKLVEKGHIVKMPPSEIDDGKGNKITVQKYYEIRKSPDANEEWIWETKARAIRDHFEKIEWSDAILVLNYTKKEIKNYIGANTFLEMGTAFYLKKPIFLLNDIPDMSNKEELLGMQPIVIKGDLEQIELLSTSST